MLAALLSLLLAVSVCASERDEYVADELDRLREAIPEDIMDYLPDDLFGSGSAHDAVGQLRSLDAGFLANYLKDKLRAAVNPAMELAASVLSLLVVCSLYGALRKAVRTDTVSRMFDFCCALCVALTLFSPMRGVIESTEQYISRICACMTALAPVSVSVMAAGGSVTAAGAFGGVLMTSVALLGKLCDSFLTPVMCAVFAFSLCGVAESEISTAGVAKLIRGFFTGTLAFVAALFGFILTMQTSLAQSADTVGSRTVKFAVDGAVPIVGGALSDAVRTVGASLSLLRDTAGWTGIAVLVLLLVPLLLMLLSYTVMLKLLAAVAGVMCCAREERIIDEMRALCGFALASASTVSAMFIFALALFVRTTLATSA